MKKGIKSGLAIGIGGTCIGIGVGVWVGMEIEKNSAREVMKPIETVSENTNTKVGESIENNSISITVPEDNDPYKKNKILAVDLQAQYNEEKKNREEERKEEYKQIKTEYLQNPDSYLLELGSEMQLTTYDYMNFDAELAEIARNEIYARHGYKFNKPKYQKIFEDKNWYVPVTDDINEIKLTDAETYNVQCLKWWENVNYDVWPITHKEGFTDCYRFNMNQTFAMDLNSDGIQEEISYKVITDVEDFVSSCAIEINGKVQDTLEGNFEPYIWVVDVDPEDAYKELVIFDEGPSNDPVDSYYYYDGEKLISMGAVEGHLNEEDYIENGILHAVKRFDILGTTRYRWDYRLTDEHIWEEIPCDYVEVNRPVIAQQPIFIYSKADTSATKAMYKKGTSFTAIGTDLIQWVKVKLEDGSEGWINAEEYPTYELGGLFFAD